MQASNPSNKDQQSLEQEVNQSLNALLPPANPIIAKTVDSSLEKANFKIMNGTSQNKLDFATSNFSVPTRENPNGANLSAKLRQKAIKNANIQKTVLSEEYSDSALIYKKYNNEGCNTRDNTRYVASMFIKKDGHKAIRFPEVVGTAAEDQLEFDSNFESGNLMLVYKRGNNVYDLVLQNDLNTGGLTQWFNFKVRNKRHNFIAKFNIVNLYKSDSLYNKGMKPCVHSAKSDKSNLNNWKRKGFNIYYEHNDLTYEDNPRKNYKTLSFEYDFTIENDTVQFAHSIPYDTARLKQLLASLQSNPKITIQTLGNSCMERSIPLLKIKSNDTTNQQQKKAIIILARQHPGQTVGSHIAEEMLLQFLRNSQETYFILWRYDIYMIPMVNIDGVALGNYRGNFSGFDLNRCWEKTDPKLQPEVFAVKSFIKKIRKKQQIQLILDLHGHSRKMGSFFYGNNFGKNSMLFPYIASKTSNNILFEESRFSSERGRKAETARVVLGKMIRQTGNVYTYEVSFYGNYKNEKSNPFSFNPNHYRQIGKSLVLAIYRTYTELYKEEKTLKESIFLKNMKQEIQELQANTIISDNDDSGSDSEAEEIVQQERERLVQFHETYPESQQTGEEGESKKQELSQIEQRSFEAAEGAGKKELNNLLGNAYGRQYYDIRNIIKSRFPAISNQQPQIKSEFQLEQQLQYTDNNLNSYNNLKKIHPSRLKVYGETYELRSRGARSEVDHGHKIPGVVKRELKTIQNKSGVNHPSKDLIIERKQLMKSFNTINHDLPRNVSLSKQLRVKDKQYKPRNKSLTLKEVIPFFNDHLTSNNAKISFDRSRFEETQPNSRGVGEYLGRNLKLPQL